MYPSDLLEEVLRHADIVDVIRTYIPVEQKGRSYVALCPFHDDKHPSLSISREKQIFKCFVCGAGGNAFSFVSRYENIPFDAAVRKVAEIAGYHDERLNKQVRERQVDPNLVPLYRCIDDLSKYYRYCLTTSEAENAREYLKKRNLFDQKDEYGIGYAPKDGKTTIKFLLAKGHSLHSIENIGITLVRSEESASDNNAGRLIFPLHNENGEVIGFSARKIDDSDGPKYVNSPETPIFHKGDNLFNYYRAKMPAKIDKYVYVLEGFMDVMALERASIKSAVAVMGTALTKEQIALLRKLRAEVRLCLDGDEAGQSGMMRLISPLRKSGIPFRLVDNAKDLRDPDEILQAEGAEVLKTKMNNLVDAFAFELNYYLNVKKLDNAEDKRKVIAHFLPILAEKEPGIEKEDYLAKLSRATGYDVEAIRREAASYSKNAIEEGESVEEVLTAPRREALERGRGNLRRRLYYAERQAIHYMVESPEAVSYYENDISHFNDEIHENLANYIADYVDEHSEKVYVPALIAQIESSGDPQAAVLIDDLTSIEGQKTYPAYTLSEMRKCHKAILEEREAMREKALLDAQISGGLSELEKAKAIEESSKRHYAKLSKKKK